MLFTFRSPKKVSDVFKRQLSSALAFASVMFVLGVGMPTIYRWTQPLTVDSTEYADLIGQRGYFAMPQEPSKITPLVAHDSYAATGPWQDLTLGANVVNTVSGGFAPAKVRLENHGSTARLMGRIEATASIGSGSVTLVSLPAGIVPISPATFAGRWSGGTAILNVTKAGNINIQQAIVATNWLSLDGITFPVKWHDEPSRISPGDLLPLENWYLTTPGSGGPQIYNLETGFYEANNFYVDTDKVSVVFSARADGGTTSGSSYPRTELRELNSDGSNASWATNSGTHTLTEWINVTGAPPVKPQVVMAQIHDATQDVIEVMYDGLKSPTAIIVRYLGTQHAIVKQPYTLGTWIKLKVVADSGSIKVYIDGTLVDTIAHTGSGCYFKAGSYVQSNVAAGDAGSARGTVKIRDVRVSHV